MKRLLLINPLNRATLYSGYHWEPLALAYVAACARPEWELELVDEQFEGTQDYGHHQADLVGLTAFTTQATRAYEIARQFRNRGIPVVMGGIHASLVPAEALRFVDLLFTGEAEVGFADLLADLRAGVPGRRAAAGSGGRVYAGGTPLPGQESIWPDRSIFRKYSYQYGSTQTTRGCPMDCSFCSVTAFNGNRFRMRDVSDVVAELGTIPQRDLVLVDDDLNGFSLRAKERCAALLRAMTDADLGKRWVTQVTINFGDDDELPRLARQAGCAAVFIGLESTDKASLALVRKDGKSRRRGLEYYAENIARLHAHGIGVVGSFILGIDTQDMQSIVAEILGFAERVALDGLNPTILTPLPGTRDFARMLEEGRLLYQDFPRDWEKYTLAFPVTTMPKVSGAGLMRRYFELLRWFRPEHVAEVYWRTRAGVSADAARHVFRWNRVWMNYCLQARVFGHTPRKIPASDPLPPEVRATERAARTLA